MLISTSSVHLEGLVILELKESAHAHRHQLGLRKQRPHVRRCERYEGVHMPQQWKDRRLLHCKKKEGY